MTVLALFTSPSEIADLPWVVVAKDQRGFALENQGKPFSAWGFSRRDEAMTLEPRGFVAQNNSRINCRGRVVFQFREKGADSANSAHNWERWDLPGCDNGRAQQVHSKT
jgi:hypothetical protein